MRDNTRSTPKDGIFWNPRVLNAACGTFYVKRMKWRVQHPMLFPEISTAYIYAWGLPSPRIFFSTASSSTQWCMRMTPGHEGSLGEREREVWMNLTTHSFFLLLLLKHHWSLGFCGCQVAEELRRLEGASKWRHARRRKVFPLDMRYTPFRGWVWYFVDGFDAC